jgi:lipopolysaccharide export system protein LptA
MSLALVAWGQERGTVTNTVITSKRLEFDYKRSIAVFEDNVRVVDPQMTMTADRMNVIFDAESGIKSVTAIGHVRITQDDKAGTCGRAVYIALTGEFIMTGSPKLQRARDTLEGTKITFWTNEDRVTCEPAMLVIYPENADKPLSLGQ